MSRRPTLTITLLALLLVLGIVPLMGQLRQKSNLFQQFVIHSGDLVLTGNNTMTINSGKYLQNGNIILKDNASLIIDHTDLALNESFPYQFRIELSNSSRFSAVSSSVSANWTLNFLASNFAFLNLTQSSGANLSLQSSGNSVAIFNHVTFSQSIIERQSSSITASYLQGNPSLTLLGSAHASLDHCFTQTLLTKATSSLTLSNSTISSLWLTDNTTNLLSQDNISVARVSLTKASVMLSLNPGMISRSQVVVPATGFNASFLQSRVGSWGLDTTSSQVTIQGSRLDGLTSSISSLTFSSSTVNITSVTGGSIHFQGTDNILKSLDLSQTQVTLNPQVLYLAGSLTTSGTSFTFSGGKIVRAITVETLDSNSQPVTGAHLTIINAGSQVVDGFTNSSGKLSFNLTFSDSSTKYQLQASKSVIQATTLIDLTTAMPVVVLLQASVPALPLSSLLTTLLILVPIARIVLNRLRNPLRWRRTDMTQLNSKSISVKGYSAPRIARNT